MSPRSSHEQTAGRMGLLLLITTNHKLQIDYRAMVLPVLDYCDAVWHDCEHGNNEKIEWLQRWAARIVYFKAASKLSTDQIGASLL